jgi:hypothetical protein
LRGAKIVNEDALLHSDIEQVDVLAVSSIDAVQATFDVMTRTVEEIEADCRSIAETLESLGEALEMFSRSTGIGQELGGFGAVGLPLLGVVKMARSVAGQYVKQQTGHPLSDWTDFVTSSYHHFEDYLSQLHTVAAIARRDRLELDAEHAMEDRAVLVETKWKTQAWKRILKRVAQLGGVVDGILRVDFPAAADAPVRDGAADARSPMSGFSGAVQRRIKDVQTRATEKSDDVRQWILQPFMALRDRAVRLPGQTERLSHQISLLEVLIELQVAELDVSLGAIPAVQARMIRLRVAANVVLPELARKLAEARLSLTEFDGYLQRLEAGHAAGAIGDGAHAALHGEYQQAATRAKARVEALEQQADGWRREGPAVVAECDAWMQLELAIADARRYVQAPEASAGSGALLRRERERLEEVRVLMAAL